MAGSRWNVADRSRRGSDRCRGQSRGAVVDGCCWPSTTAWHGGVALPLTEAAELKLRDEEWAAQGRGNH
jgi:hypothetical protein